jgi:radical SAM protein with 4Fe4S-binding SPASM domain
MVVSVHLHDFPLWEEMLNKRLPFSFDLEVTARCNNDCRHCYINLPAGDRVAREAELSLEEIERIADEAVAMGAVWCLITGGEPLLREDFADLYLILKRKGLLLSVFTNGCLISKEHVQLFCNYPPRDIEITTYGASAETYDRVTRRPGSYRAFRQGLGLLIESGVKVRLKAMALRSNVYELPEMARFCRQHTKDYFRFDPLLHLRFDGDAERNAEIRAERLSPTEIVQIEQADKERAQAQRDHCDKLIVPEYAEIQGNYLFRCSAGLNSFSVSYDGLYRLCSSLWHPDCVYDLRHGTLAEAWSELVPHVRRMTSQNAEYLQQCAVCPLSNLCLWCPAHAHLESGRLDAWCESFCEVAHVRAAAIERSVQETHL